MRLRAIVNALFYGIAPWRLYERECHYEGMSYRAHLLLNLGLAFRWATRRETEDDREFEREVNATAIRHRVREGALSPLRTPTCPPAKSRLVPLDREFELETNARESSARPPRRSS